RGVLGYSDAYFLYGVVHAPLRLLGIDTFTAFMVLMSLLAVAGYFGFYTLARRHFAIPPPWAAVGATIFAFANMNAVKLVQAQSYCAMLLPVLCLLVLNAWNAARPSRAMRLAYAGWCRWLMRQDLLSVSFRSCSCICRCCRPGMAAVWRKSSRM